VRSQVLNNTHSFTDKFNDLNNYNKTKMSLYSLKIKDTEFKVAVISDPARMKEGLANKPALGKTKGMLFDFKKEQKVTMNMKDMNYPLDMILST
jgi:uncharacterized membrane protein (UPF0127 family)